MREINLLEFRDDVKKLNRYAEWLESKRGIKVSKIYDDNSLSASTVSFPVYENTLLNFVNEASKTGLMDTNYQYVYSELAIRNHEDERRVIAEANIKNANVLCGILSKYVLGGMTKGILWNEAVEEGIFFLAVVKMKELLEMWDKPFSLDEGDKN